LMVCVGENPRLEVLVGQAVVYATEFIEHNRRQGSPGENPRVEKWKRPPEGVFKVNVAKSKFQNAKWVLVLSLEIPVVKCLRH
ncbi:hypothetical protein FCV25MIE_14000, partial [Fagus crenata]